MKKILSTIFLYIPVNRPLNDEDAEIQYACFDEGGVWLRSQYAPTVLHASDARCHPIDECLQSFERQKDKWKWCPLDVRQSSVAYDAYSYGDFGFVLFSKNRLERIDFYVGHGWEARECYRRMGRDELMALINPYCSL